jgi:hypothetical protein
MNVNKRSDRRNGGINSRITYLSMVLSIVAASGYRKFESFEP